MGHQITSGDTLAPEKIHSKRVDELIWWNSTGDFLLLLLRVSTNLERKIKEKFSIFKMCLEIKENVQM